MSLYSSNLSPLQPGEFTQPYKHAAKLFVADTFKLAPKHSFLYYVVFDIDSSQTELGNGVLNNVLEFSSRYEKLSNGMLIKDIELPKFSIGVKTLNAYNRKNIVQTNISYDPINVTFHDDAANTITNFWNDYYTYYFRDSDYTVSSYGVPEKYDRRRLNGWGFSPRNGALNTFLRGIRIFSLHNKNFTEYYLVNPIINSWRHGRHESSSNTGIMENIMTVSYETVKYFTGFINPVNVDGFSLLYYDNTKSPIAGKFLGDISVTGALNAIDGAPKDLRKPDNSQAAGGLLSSLLNVSRTYQNLKNADLKTAASTSLASVGSSVLNGVLNGTVSFPTDTTNSSGSVQNGIPINTPYTNPANSNAITFGSIAAGVVLGASVNTNKDKFTELNSAYSRGITNSLGGAAPTSGETSRVYDVVTNNRGININPSSMQPFTGTSTAYVVDTSGKVISQFQVFGTTDRSFNPTNASLNLAYTQNTTDASGKTVIVATYQDGSRVTFDSNTGDTLNIVLGSDVSTTLGLSTNVNNVPLDTRTLVANGQQIPNNIVQTVTNPTTGVITAVGGISTGRISDTLSGVAIGAVGTAFAGPFGGLVGGLIGREIATNLATTSGNQIGRAVSGGINPIVDRITGDVRQGVNNLTGAIQNVVGNWSGTGGYTPASPYSNAVSTSYNPDGSMVVSYKNGDVMRFDDLYGPTVVSKGTSTFGLSSFVNSIFGKNADVNAPAFASGFASFVVDGNGNTIFDGSGNPVISGGDTSIVDAIQGRWGGSAFDPEGSADSSRSVDSAIGPDTTSFGGFFGGSFSL